MPKTLYDVMMWVLFAIATALVCRMLFFPVAHGQYKPGHAQKIAWVVPRDYEPKDTPVILQPRRDVISERERQQLRTALTLRLLLRVDAGGQPVMVGHCRAARDGCQARIAQYVDWLCSAAEKHRVDVWTTAAMAVRESGLNPDSVGAAGEFGVMQLHPKSPWGRVAKARCRTADSCTEVVMDVATELVARYQRLCSTRPKALGAYNSGACVDNAYAQRVLKERDRLKQLAATEHTDESWPMDSLSSTR